MATAPVVIAGTYVDAIQPVVVSGMPLAGATPEQQQMPVVVVAGTYVRAQSRELARGIGSVQRGIARQLNGASSTRRLSGGTSSTAAAREAPREAALSPLRRPMFVLTVGYFWANFERPFLGCIEADFLQVNTKYSLESS